MLIILRGIHLFRRFDTTVGFFVHLCFSFLRMESRATSRFDQTQLQAFLNSRWSAHIIANLLIRCSNPEQPLRFLAVVLPYIEKEFESLLSADVAQDFKTNPLYILSLSLQTVTSRLLNSLNNSPSMVPTSPDESLICRIKSLLVSLVSRTMQLMHQKSSSIPIQDFPTATDSTALKEIASSLEIHVFGNYLLAEYLKEMELLDSAKRDVEAKMLLYLVDGIMDFSVVSRFAEQVRDIMSFTSRDEHVHILDLLSHDQNTTP